MRSQNIFVTITFCTTLLFSNVYAQTEVYNLASCNEHQISLYIDEVYKDCKEILTEELIRNYTAFIRQVEIIQLKKGEKENYPRLSTFVLKDKCNAALFYDNMTNFNPEKFNPLKYFFNYYSTAIQYIQIDQTDYYIKINPAQH